MTFRRIILLAGLAAAFASCSTTKVLGEGEYRLVSNHVRIDGSKKPGAGELTPYIRQKVQTPALGLSPMVSIYNWNGKLFKRLGTPPVVFDSDLVGASIDNMLSHMKYIGYYGSSVTARVDTNGRKVKVIYTVTPGRRYRISSINYDIPKHGEFPSDFFSDTTAVTVRPGTWLSEALLEDESARSATAMRNRGYYTLNKSNYFFEADTLSNGEAALTYSVREYTRHESPSQATPLRRFTFGDVTISRDSTIRFRDYELTSTSRIIPGMTYSERTVSNTYSRLSSFHAFNGVNIELTQSDTSTVDCAISLSHGLLQGFKLNLEGSVNSTGLFGISPQLSYYHKNIFRGGERLNLSFLGNFQFKPRSSTTATELGASASVSFPKFLGFSNRRFNGPDIPQTLVTLSYNYQDRPEFTRGVFSASYGYTGNIGKRFSYSVSPIQLSVTDVSRISAEFLEKIAGQRYLSDAFTSYFDLGMGHSIYYTTNSDVVPKNTYHYIRFSFNTSGNILSLFHDIMDKDDLTGQYKIWNSPHTQYFRTELQLGRTVFLGNSDRHSIATRLMGGIGLPYGNSTAMPFDKMFFAGGASSMRGWQARSLGPGMSSTDDLFTIPNQAGEMKLEANIEYRFPLFWKLSGALFADAGNIWQVTEGYQDNQMFRLDNLKDAIALDWGLGIRLDLSFILVRLDMGIQLHDPGLSSTSSSYWIPVRKWFPDNHYSVHFGVGYPF